MKGKRMKVMDFIMSGSFMSGLAFGVIIGMIIKRIKGKKKLASCDRELVTYLMNM